jgi:hypothetical protein
MLPLKNEMLHDFLIVFKSWKIFAQENPSRYPLPYAAQELLARRTNAALLTDQIGLCTPWSLLF